MRFKLPEINNILFQSQSVTVYTCMALKSSNSITTCNYWGFKTLHFITIVTVFGIPHKFSILSKGELENKMKCFYQIIWVYALEKKANSNTLRNQWKIKGAIKVLCLFFSNVRRSLEKYCSIKSTCLRDKWICSRKNSKTSLFPFCFKLGDQLRW